MQYLIREWAYKPMGFVSYGGVSAGTRAVEVLKRIASALRMMPIPDSVHIPFFTKWINENEDAFEPEASFTTSANLLLDELGRWAGALPTLREEVADPAEPTERYAGRPAFILMWMMSSSADGRLRCIFMPISRTR